MTKEQAYDEQIFPLMKKIIAICEEHKIAHLCHFQLDGEGDEQVFCTSANTTDDRKPTGALKEAVKKCYAPPSDLIAFAIMIGSKK